MRAELYDAGTKLLKGTHGGGSLLDVQARPGMDFGSYREVNFEYDFRNAQERIQQINADLLALPTTTTLNPWPKPWPARMWLDNTPRYTAEDGGPVFNVPHQDPYSGLYDAVPAARTELVVLGRKEEVGREDARVSTMPSMERIQAVNPSPTEWLRLPLENEQGESGTNLQEPLVMMQHTDKEGGRVTVTGDYNAITTPFDLREPSWYHVLDADGNTIATDPADVAKLCGMDPAGFYRLYVRPAKWRNVMTVVAHYFYISWFEYFPTDQVFTQAYLHRPPVYPRRHDILHPNYALDVNGVPHAYDVAMNEQWDSTEASRIMAHMIIDAQWYTMSEAYVFAGNDPGSLVTTLYPPEKDDIVLGVGRVDYPGGAEEVLWFRQTANGESLNPDWKPTTIQTFYVPWFVTPQVPG